MYTSIILPLAKEDIKEAAHWYNLKQKGLGKRFTKEVRAKISYIRKNPKTIAKRYDENQCSLLDKFPYMIHFTIDEKQKAIIISAVFHTSQNPQKWTTRE